MCQSWNANIYTLLGVEIRIGRVILFEAWGEQSKMADDERIAMDLSWGLYFCTDSLTVYWINIISFNFQQLLLTFSTM